MTPEKSVPIEVLTTRADRFLYLDAYRYRRVSPRAVNPSRKLRSVDVRGTNKRKRGDCRTSGDT